MKLAISNPRKTYKVNSELSIGLEPHIKKYDDDDAKPISYTCKMHPDSEISAEYVVKIDIFDNQGSPEDFIDTVKKMETVQEGQNIKTNEDRVKLIRQIFSGSTIDAFENQMPTTGSISDEVYKKAIVEMTKVVFPDKAARNQKRAMKKLRKPIDWTFREYANRMKKMNDYLPFFPPLPNGATPTSMSDEEFHEILHDGLPRVNYQDEMRRQDYDPTVDTFQNFVEWIERRCESLDTDREAIINKKQAPSKDLEKSSFKKKRKQGNNIHFEKDGGYKPGDTKRQKRKFCIHHRWCDHTTNECKVVQNQMKNVPPSKKFDKRSNDYHSMEKLLKTEDFHVMVKEGVTKTCNSLFKAFKKEIQEDLLLIETNTPTKRKASLANNENDAYVGLISLNQASDVADKPFDEESNVIGNSDDY